MKNLKAEYLLADSHAGVYSARAAAATLQSMADSGAAMIDARDLETIRRIAARGDDAPDHYIEDMESLESIYVSMGDPAAPLGYGIMARDGDVWLVTILSGFCDSCGAPLAACKCDVPNPMESPESVEGDAYACQMNRLGAYEVTRKADGKSIAYLAGDGACIMAREIAAIDLLSFTDKKLARRAADDVMGMYDDNGGA